MHGRLLLRGPWLHRLAAAAVAIGLAASFTASFTAILAAFAAPAAAQVTGALPPADMPLAAPSHAPVPTLRRNAVVSGDIVRIGDLIDNAGAFAAIPIFRSPDVGTTGSVPARKVIEAARSHNLFGVEPGEVIEVEVTRAGRVIVKSEVESRLGRLFAGTNGLSEAGNFVIAFDREVASFYADLTPGTDLKAMRAAYEPRSGRFDVVFEVPVGASRRTLMRYTCSLVETSDAVVPIRTIGRGETVRAADLTVERRPKAEISGDIAASATEAVGRAARQPLRLGQPIRRADLMKPELVKRDDNVTLVYQVPGIMLTTRGKALEAGGQGDLVGVLNLQTKRTIQAVVTGPGRVEIMAPTPQTVAAEIPTLPADAASVGTE
jgi:flagellar basal body P-ring formation protein FlgA